MIVVTVRPLKAELVDFSVKDETAEFNIYFNDGEERRVAFKQKIADSEELAEKMVAEMRAMSKKYHQKYVEESDDILVIKVENEDETVKKLIRFFEKVKDTIKNIRMIKNAKGYLDTITKAKKMEVLLSD
ncbi:hypothetical protein KY308_03785 [Candidatus Woesearchaeota archaeon]|nr:hypothetical protein [Candidatus Woesearchaeota archaeon]